jgi:nitrous oxidase accessory protein NosD
VTITDSSIRNFDSEGTNLTASSTVTVKTTTVSPISNLTANCVYANAPTIEVSGNSVADCNVGVYVTTTVQGTCCTGRKVRRSLFRKLSRRRRSWPASCSRIQPIQPLRLRKLRGDMPFGEPFG